MKTTVKRFVSFTTMTILVFTGNGRLGLMKGGFSSGPNVDAFVGIHGWLWIQKGSHGVSIVQFDFRFLIASICLSILVTWYLSRQLNGTRTGD
jgi:hypothetical protein